MADINDILSLAELLAEATGASMDAALKNMLALSRSAVVEAPAPSPVAEPSPAPQKLARRPYSEERLLAFLDRAHCGTEYTAPEACDRAGIIFPRWAKHPASLMRRHGWVDANGYRNGCRIYLKPANAAAQLNGAAR